MAANYNSINEVTPLVQNGIYSPSGNEIPTSVNPSDVDAVFGDSRSFSEKAANLISINRHKRPLHSLILSSLLIAIILTLSLVLVRGYGDYQQYRAENDIPMRVNVTDPYYHHFSDDSYTSTASYSYYSTFSTSTTAFYGTPTSE